MKEKLIFLYLLVFPIFASAASGFSLYGLTCDDAVNPLGMDNQKPCFGWKIHAEQSNFLQSAYQILVSGSMAELNRDEGDVWNSEKVNAKQSVSVPYQGKGLMPATTYYWKVRIWDKNGTPSVWSEPQTFSMGLLTDADWHKAQWIAMQKEDADGRLVPGIHVYENPKKILGDKKIGMYKLPQFRKTVSLKKTVKRAFAYVSGLGHFDFFINGEKVGNHFLDAGWTNYDKQVLYVTFDVTRLLNKGMNVLGVMLGNGFYNVPNERYFKLTTSYGVPKMKMLLEIEYDDGTKQQVVSDTSWKVTASPITYSSIYGGEDYDAMLEQQGWKEGGFNDKGWSRAVAVSNTATMRSQQSTPLTVRTDVPVVRKFKNAKGYWVYDLGQNFSGIIRADISWQGRDTVVFRPAELLKADSSANQKATGSPYYFSYRTRAEGGETVWQPQFSYYGFRYVQLEGAVPSGESNPNHLPEIKFIVGLHTCNSAPEAGSFVCSKPMFNQIHHIIDWAIRSNVASVLTDCPHREKLGWQEEAYLMQNSLLYRYNLSRLYTKIFGDMQASQRTDGCIPSICPEYVRFNSGFEDSPEWGSSFIIAPWNVYKWYGKKQDLETYYPDMQKYVSYLGSRTQDGIIEYGLGDWFDIGPGSPGYSQLTSKGVTATALYYQDVTIMQKVAALLGKTDDEKMYQRLGEDIRKAYIKKYMDSTTGKIDRNSQTANAISLSVGLVDAQDTARIMRNLIEDIRGRNNALTAGDVGFSYLLHTLSDHGRSDIIYDMNSKYDVPGYGWQLAHGATALTESWQAYKSVSNNHFMLGHLMEWFYSGIGGIRQSESSVAFDDIIIDPQIVGDLTSASVSYESPHGTIRSEWKLEGDDYVLHVSIPANTRASIYLPQDDANSISNFGMPISADKDINFKAIAPGKSCVNVGSGDYQFLMKNSKADGSASSHNK
jgi:hypothetical protein